ncbi:uncharacterized protein N7484_007025 [Penicillium longicatenatum]|uniref:uncharacterized protein n=1 Tax=Penicillium longicatenatum TaxID=1561947 RepID=UPI00254720D3|nr:uncharacterized protein N7484_007025 [Penicillium longicatenatum]KAJ5639163.1 hypothetical protein N7484_007025 [Penicillium longicatenatum]
MNPFSNSRLEPISEEITPADHYILCRGGTSSNLERLPSRLERSKRASPDLKKKLEEVAFESSYLKAELQWNKETKQILLNFHEQMHRVFESMEDYLAEATLRLQEAERRYLSLWERDSGSDQGVRI